MFSSSCLGVNCSTTLHHASLHLTSLPSTSLHCIPDFRCIRDKLCVINRAEPWESRIQESHEESVLCCLFISLQYSTSYFVQFPTRAVSAPLYCSSVLPAVPNEGNTLAEGGDVWWLSHHNPNFTLV